MPDPSPDLIFDEAWYLEQYSDVADVVRTGAGLTAIDHFLWHGRQEGRSGYFFDSGWYEDAYPMVRMDIRQGRASNPKEHYERYGRYRGYLPHAASTRRWTIPGLTPRLQGLWIDLPNALDIVAGRRDAGLITVTQAALLSEFIDKGYTMLKGAIPADVIDKARFDLARAYLGCYNELRFDSYTDTVGPSPWRPATNDVATGALDIHSLCSGVRELIFSDQVVSFLQLLFDSRPIVFRSEAYLRGPNKPYEQDAVRWPTTKPRHSATIWFALENCPPGMTGVGFFPGTHRMDTSPSDGDRTQVIGQVQGSKATNPEPFISPDSAKQLGDRDFAVQVLSLNCGDALVWHSGLRRFEQPPVTPQITQRSVEVHYCSSYVAPLSWERTPPQLMEYGDSGYYTSNQTSS